MHPPEVSEKGVEDAAGRDVGNLGIKIARFALAQSELLLHFFEKHLNRPARGVDLHHGDKRQRGVRGQKHAPLFLIREAAHVQFDISDVFVVHHHLVITGVQFAATLGVAGFFEDCEQRLGVHLVPLVEIPSLVFAHPTHYVEGAIFDLPDCLDEPFAAEPTIGQHIVRLKPVLDRPLDHSNRLGHFVPGAFLASDSPGGPGAAGFPVLLAALAPAQAFFGVSRKIERDKGRSVKKAQHEVFKPQQRFPDHRVEPIGDVFEVPPDPAVGGRRG